MKYFFQRKDCTVKQREFNKKQAQNRLDFYLLDDDFIPIAELVKRRYFDDELITKLADLFEVSELMVATKLFNTGLISSL